jgi:hypothetical protein
LNDFVEHEFSESLSARKELKHERLSGFSIEDPDFQTVKVQLRALGLIAKSTRPRSVKDTDTYWALTPYGDTVMTSLRAIRRRADSREPSWEPAESPSPEATKSPVVAIGAIRPTHKARLQCAARPPCARGMRVR